MKPKPHPEYLMDRGVFVASETTIYHPLPVALRHDIADHVLAVWDPSRSVAINFLNILYRQSKPEISQEAIAAYDLAKERHWIGELGTILNSLGNNPTTDDEMEISRSPLMALRQYISHLFAYGPRAASYFYARLENAVRKGTTVIDRLELPGSVPGDFFSESYPWDSQSLASTLVLVVAAPLEWTYDALRFLNRAMGHWSHVPHDMKGTESASLRDAFEAGKKGATEKRQTTVLCVELVDLASAAMSEMRLKAAWNHTSFGQTFVMVIGPEGVMTLRAGGPLEGYTLPEYGKSKRDRIQLGKEGNRFVADFEKFAVREVRSSWY